MCTYLTLVVVLYLCLAGHGMKCFDIKEDPGYKDFLAHLIRTVKRDSQKFMTDHGYGSRLRAGTNVADAVTAYGQVYGSYGPGKRSAALSVGYFDIASDKEKINFQEAPELSKRYISDHGYGSRVSAGKNIARDNLIKDTIYGAGGPGKRSGFLRMGKSGVLGDAGYLSRIEAAKKLSNDNESRYNLFGCMGHGRRR